MIYSFRAMRVVEGERVFAASGAIELVTPSVGVASCMVAWQFGLSTGGLPPTYVEVTTEV